MQIPMTTVESAGRMMNARRCARCCNRRVDWSDRRRGAGVRPTPSTSPTRRGTRSPCSTARRSRCKETIPVGKRPRGIILTKDDKYLLICASDEDTVQMLDVESREIVGDLPSGPDPELLDLHPSGSPVYVANEDDNLLTVIDLNDKKVVAEVEVGVEPEGVGVSPDGKTVVVTSETTNMAHFIDTDELRDHRQRAGRFAAALRRVHGRRQPAMGDLGGGRRGFGDRRQDAQDHQGDRLCRSGRAAGANSARRRAHHQGRHARPSSRSDPPIAWR